MSTWTCALELDSERRIVSGSEGALAQAISRGADLRVGTEFRHDEHIDVDSNSPEMVREVAEFGVTYLVDGRWTAGIMSLRQPVGLPHGFGPRPSMSFFLYNQDGQQAIARPFLDGEPADGEPGPSPVQPPPDMPKYHAYDNWDAETNAPSHNFVYDFEYFRFLVSDSWREVLVHDAEGRVQSGSVEELGDAFASGGAVKVGVEGLCGDLRPGEDCPPTHEVFVQTGSCYYYTDQQLFIAGSHPVVRVRPGIPMKYETGGWDFGWLMLRTDGRVVYRRCDPYTLKFTDLEYRRAIRWFVR